MAIELTCPHCAQQLSIKRPRPGKPIYCPVCTGQIPVPWATTESDEADEPAANDWWQKHPDQDHQFGPPMRVVAPKWYQTAQGLAVGAASAGALLLVAGLVCGAFWLGRSSVPVAAPESADAGFVHLSLVEPELRQPELLAEPALVAALPLEPVVELPPLIENPPAPVVELPPKPAEPVKVVVRRMSPAADEDLRRLLLKMPEVQLDPPGGNRRSTQIQQLSGQSNAPFHFSPTVLTAWQDLQGLPFRKGAECQLGKEPAEHMSGMSRQMRGILAESMKANPADPRMDPETIRQKIGSIYAKTDFHKEAAVPCLMQMLQPENTPIRKVMVEQLASIKRPRATEALVRVALFDLSDALRQEAIQELSQRSREDYRHLLLDGLRYPWAPVAEHAAEALVALNDKMAVSALKRMADEPDPTAATYDPTQKAWIVPEVVRINHLSNCVMCHAPSRSNTDLVRGRVPTQNQPLPPLTQYYEDNSGSFVRADVTYLKQDFSVYQPVERPGQWPAMQRFDYLVRVRQETNQEFYLRQQRKSPPATYPQREAVLFALRELGQN